jgi:hypothetical protein
VHETTTAYRFLSDPDCEPNSATFVKAAPLPERSDRVIYWEERQPAFGLMVRAGVGG